MAKKRKSSRIKPVQEDLDMDTPVEMPSDPEPIPETEKQDAPISETYDEINRGQTITVETEQPFVLISKAEVQGLETPEVSALVGTDEERLEVPRTPTTVNSATASLSVSGDGSLSDKEPRCPTPDNKFDERSPQSGYGEIDEGLKDEKFTKKLDIGFPNLLSSGLYSDVTLVIGWGKTLHGHRAIIGEKTDLLGAKFHGYRYSTSDGRMGIKLDTREYEYVWPIIQYAYTGELHLTKNLGFLLKLALEAKFLGAEPVWEYVTGYLEDMVRDGTFTRADFQTLLEVLACNFHQSEISDFTAVFKALSQRDDFFSLLQSDDIKRSLQANGMVATSLLYEFLSFSRAKPLEGLQIWPSTKECTNPTNI